MLSELPPRPVRSLRTTVKPDTRGSPPQRRTGDSRGLKYGTIVHETDDRGCFRAGTIGHHLIWQIIRGRQQTQELLGKATCKNKKQKTKKYKNKN